MDITYNISKWLKNGWSLFSSLGVIKISLISFGRYFFIMSIMTKHNIYKINLKYIEYLQRFEKCIVEPKDDRP